MTPYLQQKTLYPALISEAPDPTLGLVVVIPAYDEPHLIKSLNTLRACWQAEVGVEVIVVLNHSEAATAAVKARQEAYYKEAAAWAKKQQQGWLRFHILYCPDLPAKHAGVGLARKIGMDEACRRLETVGCPDGLIVGFDADSNCLPNYLQAIAGYFRAHPSIQAAGIHFEHPLHGAAFPEANYQAITAYELHLRYFINAQAWVGLPYAYQTIGSSMAVRCRAYQEQGGMNRRKAGEDFYFLHKFTALGYFGQINSTTVIPSPRASHRVPFGTGRAVSQLLENNLTAETYAPESFVQLLPFIRQLNKCYRADYEVEIHPALEHFLQTVDWQNKVAEIRQHTADLGAFRKRFFRWFDAFLLMKYVHFMRDHYYPNVPVEKAAAWLTDVSGYNKGVGASSRDLLLLWRHIDKED